MVDDSDQEISRRKKFKLNPICGGVCCCVMSGFHIAMAFWSFSIYHAAMGANVSDDNYCSLRTLSSYVRILGLLHVFTLLNDILSPICLGCFPACYIVCCCIPCVCSLVLFPLQIFVSVSCITICSTCRLNRDFEHYHSMDYHYTRMKFFVFINLSLIVFIYIIQCIFHCCSHYYVVTKEENEEGRNDIVDSFINNRLMPIREQVVGHFRSPSGHQLEVPNQVFQTDAHDLDDMGTYRANSSSNDSYGVTSTSSSSAFDSSTSSSSFSMNDPSSSSASSTDYSNMESSSASSAAFIDDATTSRIDGYLIPVNPPPQNYYQQQQQPVANDPNFVQYPQVPQFE